VGTAGRLEADNDRAKIRRREPPGNRSLENAALVAARRVGRGTLAGDNEDDAGAVGLGPLEEGDQAAMGGGLGQAMEIDASVDGGGAAGKA
jgi:hypothetical protein